MSDTETAPATSRASDRPVDITARRATGEDTRSMQIEDAVIEARGLGVYYGEFRAVRDVTMRFGKNEITALIGPSGCGKSTVLRCFNRMNDLIPSARVEGTVIYNDTDIYSDDIDPVEVRRRIGMVFQKPNPFPKSIFDNVAWGAKINGFKGSRGELSDLVERALRQAALWDEVKDKLPESGYSLSGGQQQRLCIARAIATNPDVVLMDEPASALDPIATLRIEELMQELKNDYSIIIVTHNMQQAARISDRTAFFSVDVNDAGMRTGRLVEYGYTDKIFTTPEHEETEQYITGRFG
jgi:phosphate transport system ATP-binding protein